MFWLLPVLNTVAIVSTTATIIYWLFCIHMIKRARKLMPELPYPDGYVPILGHTFKFILTCQGSTELWEKITEYCDYYKEGFQGFIGHQVWMYIPDHHVMQEILASHEAIEKSYVYRHLDCITDGVFLATNGKWRKLRKRLNLTFSPKQLDSYMDTVYEHTKVFINVIIRKLQQSNQYVDLLPYIARCYFDIMTKTHFAGNTDQQVNDTYQVSEKASKVLQLLIDERLLKPHMHVDFIFKFTSLYKYINEIRKKPFFFVSELVEKRITSLNQKNNNDHNDSLVYVDLVIQSMKELNLPMDINNIQLNCNDLLIAGSDTTSVSTATLLYHLAVRKDIQEKVYEEVSTIYGQESLRPLTRHELNSLTYLDMVVNEGLRWSAPPGFVRELHKDFDVGKYVIPKTANVYLMVSPQHYNPEYFERPNEFYPEHFASEAANIRPKMAFLPFSSGPRNCPGKAFAYILLKSTVAHIINNYKLDSDLPLDQVKRKFILMTHHCQGYPIKFVPRDKRNCI